MNKKESVSQKLGLWLVRKGISILLTLTPQVDFLQVASFALISIDGFHQSTKVRSLLSFECVLFSPQQSSLFLVSGFNHGFKSTFLFLFLFQFSWILKLLNFNIKVYIHLFYLLTILLDCRELPIKSGGWAFYMFIVRQTNEIEHTLTNNIVLILFTNILFGILGELPPIVLAELVLPHVLGIQEKKCSRCKISSIL